MEICRGIAPVILAYQKFNDEPCTECAHALGISCTAFNAYIAGRGNPSSSTLRRLAKKLGVDLPLLLCGDYTADQLITAKRILDLSGILGKASAADHSAITYRMPMRVQAIRAFSKSPHPFSFPICPRCERTMEREYQSYCDRCGQALEWTGFSHAAIIQS